MSTWAFSDIHGNYQLWKQIRDFCKEDDIIYFLGDAIDRGADGIKILQELFNDKRVVFIRGNHEEMLIKYIENGVGTTLRDKNEMSIIRYNEGVKTLKDFQLLSVEEREELYYNLKNKTLYKYLYINKDNKKISLSHSGFSIASLLSENSDEFIWNRDHIMETEWDNNYNDFYMVHGHTPIQHLQTKNEELKDKKSIAVCKYCNQHKIDIDLGCFVSNKIALLNLDTLETTYFKVKEDKDE